MWRRMYAPRPLHRLATAASAAQAPVVSLLITAGGGSEERLVATIESLRAQSEPRWELLVPAGSLRPSPATRADPRLRTLPAEREPGRGTLEEPLAAARGEWIGFVAAGDLLDRDALARLAAAGTAAGAALVHSDEDRLDGRGRHFEPCFKPSWDRDLFYACDYLGQLRLLRRSAVLAAGGEQIATGSACRYELALRVTAANPQPVVRVPLVLFHAAAEEPEPTARRLVEERDALERHLRRIAAVTPEVLPAPGTPGARRLRWPLPRTAPTVSVIVSACDALPMLERCLAALSSTAYKPLEILVVDSGSRESTRRFLAAGYRRGEFRSLTCDGPDNIPAANNLGSSRAAGDLLVFLGGNTEPLAPGWLDEMVRQASRPDIGAVGAKLVDPDGRIHHAGMLLGAGRRLRPVASNLFRGLPREAPGYLGTATVTHQVSAVAVSCMVLRREPLERAGGFDERLAAGFSDVDLSLRLRALGFRILWTPEAELLHHGPGSREPVTAPEQARLLAGAAELMRERWGAQLDEDPFYSPNLDPLRADFALAFPPRWRV